MCTRIQIERNLNIRIKLKRKKIQTLDNPSNIFISFFTNSIFYKNCQCSSLCNSEHSIIDDTSQDCYQYTGIQSYGLMGR